MKVIYWSLRESLGHEQWLANYAAEITRHSAQADSRPLDQTVHPDFQLDPPEEG